MSASSCSMARRSEAGTPVGPAPARARLGELAQVRGGGVPGRHQLARVLVAQLIEAEVAGSGERCARRQQLRRIEPAPNAPARAGSAPRSGTAVRRPLRPARRQRIAVRASCSGRRARTCMCTSPQATSGTWCCAPRRRQRRAGAPHRRPRAAARRQSAGAAGSASPATAPPRAQATRPGSQRMKQSVRAAASRSARLRV